MEILELQDRINYTLDALNSAKSISKKRRYFAYLSGLVSIYNSITGSKVQIAEMDNQNIMKPTFYQSFIQEISHTEGLLLGISDGILKTRQEVGCEFRPQFLARTYGRKYLSEILESFLADLGDRFYRLYKEAETDGRLFYNQEFSGGITTFDYPMLKSFIFLPKDRETIPFLITTVHELGHAFDYDYTKCSRKAVNAVKFNVNIETFSMFLEILLIEYLKRIHFDPDEVKMIEEKICNDLIGHASEVNFGLSLSETFIDPDFKLVLRDLDDAARCYDEFLQKYGLEYIKGDINYENSVQYMYGGLIANIYAYYYGQDRNFINEICKHFLDYEAYSTEEILERLPFVKEELNGFPILRKKLEQVKANQN